MGAREEEGVKSQEQEPGWSRPLPGTCRGLPPPHGWLRAVGAWIQSHPQGADSCRRLPCPSVPFPRAKFLPRANTRHLEVPPERLPGSFQFNSVLKGVSVHVNSHYALKGDVLLFIYIYYFYFFFLSLLPSLVRAPKAAWAGSLHPTLTHIRAHLEIGANPRQKETSS